MSSLDDVLSYSEYFWNKFTRYLYILYFMYLYIYIYIYICVYVSYVLGFTCIVFNQYIICMVYNNVQYVPSYSVVWSYL